MCVLCPPQKSAAENAQTMPESDPVTAFRALKGRRPIVCLTACTAPVAAALDPYCDLLLVGDSLAMVVYGMDSTRDIDLDTMIRHASARRGPSG